MSKAEALEAAVDAFKAAHKSGKVLMRGPHWALVQDGDYKFMLNSGGVNSITDRQKTGRALLSMATAMFAADETIIGTYHYWKQHKDKTFGVAR